MASWPPLAGDVVFGDERSSVAICVLASRSLLASLAGRPELAIAGRVLTENVGVERMVKNLIANPRLSTLIVCGRDSSHRVGPTILSLHSNGLDAGRRVIGPAGPEAVLPNLSDDEVDRFRRQVTIVDLIGERDVERILAVARERGGTATATEEDTASPKGEVGHTAATSTATRHGPREGWTYDPTGFLLIFVDRRARKLRVEHYSRDRRLRNVVEGDNARDLCFAVLDMGLVSELTHAAYLGRELARAEDALRLGLHYEQDVQLDARRPAL